MNQLTGQNCGCGREEDSALGPSGEGHPRVPGMLAAAGGRNLAATLAAGPGPAGMR
jgi:hypothetical protein